MRCSFYTLLAVLSVCSGCSRGFHLDKSQQLGNSSHGSVFAETWYEDAPLAGSVWKVCLRPKASTNSEVLFTVQSVFQESEPGYPHLVVTNGIEVIEDSTRSYMYSLSSRQFITNAWPAVVYAGDSKQKQYAADGVEPGECRRRRP